MCGLKKDPKVNSNGSGMSKIKKMIKGSILILIKIFNHFQDIMDPIYGHSSMSKIVSKVKIIINKCAWNKKYCIKLYPGCILPFLRIYLNTTKT